MIKKPNWRTREGYEKVHDHVYMSRVVYTRGARCHEVLNKEVMAAV
jgi:hypothetical protein